METPVAVRSVSLRLVFCMLSLCAACSAETAALPVCARELAREAAYNFVCNSSNQLSLIALSRVRAAASGR